MSIIAFKTELREVLSVNGASSVLMAWGARVIDESVDVQVLQDLILEDRQTAMHFSWMLGGICMIQPQCLEPSLVYFFEKRHEVKFSNFDRSLAKFFLYVGIPSEIEGTVIDMLLTWLDRPGISISTKCYALKCLIKVVKKHPDLKQELILIIENQMGKNSKSFDQLAKRSMGKINSLGFD